MTYRPRTVDDLADVAGEPDGYIPRYRPRPVYDPDAYAAGVLAVDPPCACEPADPGTPGHVLVRGSGREPTPAYVCIACRIKARRC